MNIRPAERRDVSVLARLWHAGWQDAHAAILPPALARARTLESFEDRLKASLDHVRVAEISDVPLGFHMLKDDELDQFYVAAGARGTGLAAALIEDAETTLAANGVELAWLACAIGNDRAARFYQRCGWSLACNFVRSLDTIAGPFELEVWRYEKRLPAVPIGRR